jgi:circadian clock protein KaiC
LTILTVAQHGLIGTMHAPLDVTYLADTIIFFRFFEASGQVRKAISVLKKRVGRHEDTIREFQISAEGIRVGSPLSEFRGILTGVPEYSGKQMALLQKQP